MNKFNGVDKRTKIPELIDFDCQLMAQGF